ncbi:GNAT family N-acetyltransferase [Mesobacterium sp. TK19101]|uniref:GNAT family N-acetyltransferase n=1 Tax=Mesobacterium hydrothermale TaxID=3111907 RepID=A0ABU6HGQ0_9RHOB|nr:GNAT family N-acetyltransferase [Mesobacterium sp. TK19101]MEC3861592.1 GNAT family N-acetyltransferase [Mesobacterium sp. TK19101]
MQSGGAGSAWHVAEDRDGAILGFQWVAPNPDLPPDACEIATFVQTGKTGLGTGSRLFETTKSVARALGYDWISAEIRADNSGGLAYYQSRGFEDYGRRNGVVLADGLTVDKVLKRFDL